MKNKEMEKSIQLLRDGIEGIMKCIPTFIADNKNVRGVRHSFSPHSNFGMFLGGALEVAKALEDVEKVDTPEMPFMGKVEIHNMDGFKSEGNTAEEFRHNIDAELESIWEKVD